MEAGSDMKGEPRQIAAAWHSPTDQGQTWGDYTVVADDLTGALLWWDLDELLVAKDFGSD